MHLHNQEKSHNWEKGESMEHIWLTFRFLKNARKMKKNLIIIIVLEGFNNDKETWCQFGKCHIVWEVITLWSSNYNVVLYIQWWNYRPTICFTGDWDSFGHFSLYQCCTFARQEPVAPVCFHGPCQVIPECQVIWTSWFHQ